VWWVCAVEMARARRKATTERAQLQGTGAPGSDVCGDAATQGVRERAGDGKRGGAGRGQSRVSAESDGRPAGDEEAVTEDEEAAAVGRDEMYLVDDDYQEDDLEGAMVEVVHGDVEQDRGDGGDDGNGAGGVGGGGESADDAGPEDRDDRDHDDDGINGSPPDHSLHHDVSGSPP
jgi:hypothetical protein